MYAWFSRYSSLIWTTMLVISLPIITSFIKYDKEYSPPAFFVFMTAPFEEDVAKIDRNKFKSPAIVEVDEQGFLVVRKIEQK